MTIQNFQIKIITRFDRTSDKLRDFSCSDREFSDVTVITHSKKHFPMKNCPRTYHSPRNDFEAGY